MEVGNNLIQNDLVQHDETTRESFVDAAQAKYTQARLRHWNEVACHLKTWTGWGGYYHQRLTQVYRSLVAPGQSVLELGCAPGRLACCAQPYFGCRGRFFRGDDPRGKGAARSSPIRSRGPP